MDWVTFDSTKKSWWSVPTYNGVDMFKYGVVSLAHLIPFGLFQSRLLYIAFACTLKDKGKLSK